MSAESGGAEAALDFPISESTRRPGYSRGDLSCCLPGDQDGKEIGKARLLPGSISAEHEEHPMPVFGNDPAPPQVDIARHLIGAVKYELGDDAYPMRPAEKRSPVGFGRSIR